MSHPVAEACHLADRVICVSGVLAEEVRAQYGVHPAKMTVIYNGINCNKFDGEVDPGAVKHTYGVGALDPMFLFVGTKSLYTLTTLVFSPSMYLIQSWRVIRIQ